jgi:anti-sigma-K factor RskA
MKKNDLSFDSSPDSIQLEDLFELKRNEKPQADFWDNFDAQLQQRILNSAIDRRNPIQRGWDILSAKLLPVSAIATATAAIAFTIAPLFQHTQQEQPVEKAPVTDTQIRTVANVPIASVDFHNVTLSATNFQESASHNFLVTDISDELKSSAAYETNALVVSADPLNLQFEEQLF